LCLVTGNAVGTVLRELHDAGNTLPVGTTIGNMTYGGVIAWVTAIGTDVRVRQGRR
jgi:hypothetical protein